MNAWAMGKLTLKQKVPDYIWEGSRLSHAKKPGLYPASKDGLMPRYNWAIERWPQSLQIICDVLLSPIYKVKHTTIIVPKMPAEKTRKLSIVFLFTLI